MTKSPGSRLVFSILFAIVISSSAASAQTNDVQVYPSGSQIPANLLRISLQFNQPADEAVLARLSLQDGSGPIAAPFYPQELWSADGSTLTVLIHPGRLKSGLTAHDQLGPVLQAGTKVRLVLDGTELKSWMVSSSDASPPRPQKWRLSAPRAGTRNPLRIMLDGPIDHQALDLIAIQSPDGSRVDGEPSLSEAETVWSFTPGAHWSPGKYRVQIDPVLEDPSGNRIGERFERPARSGEPRADLSLPLDIRP